MSRQLGDCDWIDRNDGFSSNVDMNTGTPQETATSAPVRPWSDTGRPNGPTGFGTAC